MPNHLVEIGAAVLIISVVLIFAWFVYRDWDGNNVP